MRGGAFEGISMSNVLIGIIGVILFIGLALAGALILGDDFLTASSSSRAVAELSRGKQIMHAVNMHDLKTGKKFGYRHEDGSRSYPGELEPRFLKSGSVPTGWHFHSNADGGVLAVRDLQANDETREICLEAMRQSGQIPAESSDTTIPSLSITEINSYKTGCSALSMGGNPYYMLFASY